MGLTGLMTMAVFLLYYVSGVLSFGRATWIGGSMAFSLILYFVFVKETRAILLDMLFAFLGIALMNMLWVFKVQNAYGGKFIPVLILLGLGLLGLMYFDKKRQKTFIMILLFVIYGALLQFCTVYWHHLLVNAGIVYAVLKLYAAEILPIQKQLLFLFW